MTDRIREIAQRIANGLLYDAEYCEVYEDDQVQDMTEDEWQEIHNLILGSRAVLPDA